MVLIKGNAPYIMQFRSMSLDLQELFIKNCRSELNSYIKNRIGTFQEFIDHAFTWSETEEGRDFWSAIAHADTGEEVVRILEKLKNRKAFRDHLEGMNPARKLIFQKFINKDSEDNFYNKVGSLSSMVNCITWSDTPIPTTYWACVSDGEENTLTRSIESEWTKAVATIDGKAVLKMDAVQLSVAVYGKDKYIEAGGKIKIIKAYTSALEFENILKPDAVEVWQGKTEKRHYSKKCLQALGLKEFEGQYYSGESALNKHSIYLVKNESGLKELERVNFTDFVHYNGDLCRRSMLGENVVYINQTTHDNFEVHMDKEKRGVFLCQVSRKYFYEDFAVMRRAQFVGTDGIAEEIVINPSHARGITFRGQLVNTINFETPTGRIDFFSRRSAENFGLTITTCEHCENHVSQHHDFESCKRQNFKNVRYDYHSQKPKRVYSNALFKIGVEIEKESYEGATHKAPSIYSRFGWVKERDGSLDGRIGYELVSPCYPLFSSKLYSEAVKIEETFPQLINGDISEQCGGHIHFSRRDMNGSATLETYCGYLPLLYAIYKSRTKKSYSHAKEKDEMKNSSEKYQAVRVLSDRIEFRIFPAVKNLKSLKWRIDLLRYMAKNPTASPLKVVNDLCDKRTSLHKLFKQIFAEQTIYKRALDTLVMAKQYDRNYYNIDFTKQSKNIQAKAKRHAKK